MSGLTVRAARSGDLEAVVDLLREDVIREVDESQEPASSYRAAFEEIRADGHQDLLVGEVGGEVVATAQVTWVRPGSSSPRTRAASGRRSSTGRWGSPPRTSA